MRCLLIIILGSLINISYCNHGRTHYPELHQTLHPYYLMAPKSPTNQRNLHSSSNSISITSPHRQRQRSQSQNRRLSSQPHEEQKWTDFEKVFKDIFHFHCGYTSMSDGMVVVVKWDRPKLNVIESALKMLLGRSPGIRQILKPHLLVEFIGCNRDDKKKAMKYMVQKKSDNKDKKKHKRKHHVKRKPKYGEYDDDDSEEDDENDSQEDDDFEEESKKSKHRKKKRKELKENWNKKHTSNTDLTVSIVDSNPDSPTEKVNDEISLENAGVIGGNVATEGEDVGAQDEGEDGSEFDDGNTGEDIEEAVEEENPDEDDTDETA